jgi:hypothetical protein
MKEEEEILKYLRNAARIMATEELEKKDKTIEENKKEIEENKKTIAEKDKKIVELEKLLKLKNG